MQPAILRHLHILTVAGVLLGALLLAPAALATEPEWLVRAAAGLRLEYTAADAPLVERLWPALEADRAAVMERLRLFPPEPLRIVLAPTEEAFHRMLGGATPSGTLGVYLLGEHTLVLRAPRSAPGGGIGGNWDPRGVLRHELAHAVIDAGIAQPVPLWLHEGLAVLVSDELSYLDEAELTGLAVVGRLIPLPALLDRFPQEHGLRGLAYAQAASFVRFLLRERGMAGLQQLLRELARDVGPSEAFLLTYGEPLDALEQRWHTELAGRFSYVSLVTTTSLLGGLGLPLLLLALGRRWLQRRRAYRQWEAEERLRAAVRGEPPPPPGQPPRAPAPGAGASPERRRLLAWRPPRPPRGNGTG